MSTSGKRIATSRGKPYPASMPCVVVMLIPSQVVDGFHVVL
jgi:hypothetical protein